MGCGTSVSGAPMGWHISHTATGSGTVEELSIRFSGKTSNRRDVVVEGLLLDELDGRLFIKGLKKGSDLLAELTELQHRFPEDDFGIDFGEELVSVNGISSIDGMLRALQWERQLNIVLHRTPVWSKFQEVRQPHRDSHTPPSPMENKDFVRSLKKSMSKSSCGTPRSSTTTRSTKSGRGSPFQGSSVIFNTEVLEVEIDCSYASSPSSSVCSSPATSTLSSTGKLSL
mmetsp:Transcript_2383/g.5061  ORF Transcript_2383/g.5061 Transcript_2383/m.5061 type:complete len:228 (-) Transcript_2383:149-832(-)